MPASPLVKLALATCAVALAVLAAPSAASAAEPAGDPDAVTFTVDSAEVNADTGLLEVSGTITCQSDVDEPATIKIVDADQDSGADGATADGGAAFPACDSQSHDWTSAALADDDHGHPWQHGEAVHLDVQYTVVSDSADVNQADEYEDLPLP